MQSYKNFREIEVLQEVRDWKLEVRGYQWIFSGGIDYAMWSNREWNQKQKHTKSQACS